MNSKYGILMENLVVTEDMHKRIMKNIEDFDFTNDKEEYKKNYKKTLYIAASILILFIGLIGAQNILKDKLDDDLLIGNLNLIEYENIEDLSKEVGYQVRKLERFPFEVENVIYRSFGKNIVEIIYEGGEESLNFRMGKGKDDISGDYYNYEEERLFDVGGIKLLLKGAEGKYQLATWQDSDFTYAISTSSSLDKDKIIEMIESLK